MDIKLSEHFTYKKLLQFVLPSIIMMVFTSIYGVVDGLFVSNCVGDTAFAAINIIMPFIMILGGMGFMIGTGGTALVAKTLGQGKKDKANRIFTMMVIFTIALGAVLTLLGVLFVKPISCLLGANDEMIADCVSYGTVSILFTVTFMLQNVFQSFLIAAEKPKLGLFYTVAAGVTNMALDALFVAVFRWGVVGAAVATGISQLVGGVLPLIYFMRKNDSALRLVTTKIEAKYILRACANGSSELMTNVSSSVVSVVYNLQLMHYLQADGVAAYGVLMYVQFIFIAIFIGYSVGCAPIVGYHYGAQNSDELKNILKKSTVLLSLSGAALFGAAVGLAPVFAQCFFSYNPYLCDLTTHAFRLFSSAFLLAGLNIFGSAFFTALNNGFISATISFLRTLAFQLSAVLLLPLAIGVDGIWLAITVAEVCCFIVTLAFLLINHKRYGYM